MIVSEGDDGSTVELYSGGSLTLRLAENRTTGYRWHPEEWDRAVLELTADQYIPPADLRPGAGGQHEWRFVAREPGAVTLRLAYRRGWGQESPARTFSLTVAVG